MTALVFDPKTIGILRNFSTINPSLLFKQGSELSTISPSKTILAKAKVDVEFQQDFAIFDLSRFLSVLSLFGSPTIDFADKYLTISEDAKKVNYTFADPENIKTPPDKELKLPSVDVAVSITEADFANVSKALSVLRLPEIAFVGNGEVIQLQAMDSKNPRGDTYSIKVGETDREFRAVFKAENLKLIAGDYDVKISSKGISHFASPTVEYYIAVEAKESKF